MLIGSVEDKVINMFNHLEQEIREARTILVLFSRLNTLIRGLFVTCAIVRQDKG